MPEVIQKGRIPIKTWAPIHEIESAAIDVAEWPMIRAAIDAAIQTCLDRNTSEA